jgi:hypothetical protein
VWHEIVRYEIHDGKARYRYPGEGGASNCIFPKLPDGSTEVMIGVIPNEAEVLRGDECFGMYLGRRGCGRGCDEKR